MKYVIFDNKYPVVFPDSIIHCDISLDMYLGMKPTSAGHLNIKGNKIKVYGESESLGLKPKPEDKKLLETLINENNKN